jgi:tetratricopeptide (TPR) repeat protein
VESLCYLLPVARNIDRKELRNPDQFVSFWTHAGEKLKAHRTKVIGAVTAVLVVGLAIVAITSLTTKKAVAVSADFGRIERVAKADLLPAVGEPPKADDGLPHFKTEQERLEAALKEVDTFLGAHGSSNLREEALLLKAKYLLALGKTSDALAIYQGQLGNLDGRLRFLATEGLGYALEASGQTDAAIAAFGSLADDNANGPGFYRDHALYDKARLLEKKGSPKDAEKLLHEILDKTPTTPLREEINDRLASLEGK